MYLRTNSATKSVVFFAAGPSQIIASSIHLDAGFEAVEEVPG